MILRKKIRKIFDIFLDCYIRKHLRKGELIKFLDKRRKEIYSSVLLDTKKQEEIDSLYLTCYGEKIPHIWHRHFTAFTGSFDKYYFPELLYIPELERYLNIYSQYSNVFSDKNVLPFVAKSAGVLTPEVLFSRVKGMFRNSNNERIDSQDFLRGISDLGECFFKPTVDSNSGKRCFLSFLKNGFDERNRRDISSLLNELGDDFVIQKRIVCDASISNIYPNSVNTFRVISYRWKDCIFTTPSIMRIGQGGHFLDNAHAGGMFIAIDDDGSLHKTAFTEFKKEYVAHPNSGVVFYNYKISSFPSVLSAAKKMHESLPQIGIINWDFTINQDGLPVLIEGNMMGGGIWVSQMAHGKGVFGNRTPEILMWMRRMKTYSLKEKKLHAFGA